MVPALVILFSFDQKVAQGTSMGAMIGIAIMGFYRYVAEPSITVDYTPVLLMGIAALGGAFLGVKVAAALPRTTLQKIFAVIMLVAAVRLFMKSIRPPEPQASDPANSGPLQTGPQNAPRAESQPTGVPTGGNRD
jgi:uncharacterized membrane protein YfcA